MWQIHVNASSENVERNFFFTQGSTTSDKKDNVPVSTASEKDSSKVVASFSMKNDSTVLSMNPKKDKAPTKANCQTNDTPITIIPVNNCVENTTTSKKVGKQTNNSTNIGGASSRFSKNLTESVGSTSTRQEAPVVIVESNSSRKRQENQPITSATIPPKPKRLVRHDWKIYAN